MIKRHYDYVLERFIDENKSLFNQFLHFLFVHYLIDPYFIILYRKKNFEILTNFIRTRFLRPTRKIAKFCKLATILGNSESSINSL